MAIADAAERPPQRRSLTATLRLRRPELWVLLALAATLNLWALAQNGWANEYYSATVRGMASSWHNLLFDSFDSSGVMTVDKPPLSLWVQALSVRVFGFHPLSVLVPQALMGVASVAVIYDLTRSRFGRVAGLVAGLVLATTPTAVAVSRHNNPDALLVLCTVAALWLTIRALDTGRTRWLVLAGVCVGLGFETKMTIALVVLPGMLAAWLWVAPRGRSRAAGGAAACCAAAVVVGGAWPLLMALTPAASRPWVSGTSDNSILSLILDYNGFGRLGGQAGGPQAFGGPGGPSFFGGSTGPLRLLNSSFGGQAGWLLGVALAGGVAVLLASRLRRSDPRSGWLIATGGAFLTTAVVLSAAQGIIHPYYVSLLAPFTAALVGAGAGELAGRGLHARVIAPLAVLAGVASELLVLHTNPEQLDGLRLPLVAVGVATAAALTLARRRRARAIALAVAVAALLVAPATWAVDTLDHPANGTFPAGGPRTVSADRGPGGPTGGFGRIPRQLLFGAGPPPAGGPPAGLASPAGGPPPGVGPSGPGGFAGGPPPGGFAGGPGPGGGPFGGDRTALTAVVRYVSRHGGGTIAVSSQSGAAGAIVTNHASIAGIGGFSGRESAVSITWLADRVEAGAIRWVLASETGRRRGRDGRTGASGALAAVARRCRPASGVAGLYDCQGQASALRRG